MMNGDMVKGRRVHVAKSKPPSTRTSTCVELCLCWVVWRVACLSVSFTNDFFVLDLASSSQVDGRPCPTVVFIRDVADKATETDMRKLFEPVCHRLSCVLHTATLTCRSLFSSFFFFSFQVGTIVAMSFAQDRNGVRKGTALVQLESEVRPCGLRAARCALVTLLCGWRVPGCCGEGARNSERRFAAWPSSQRVSFSVSSSHTAISELATTRVCIVETWLQQRVCCRPSYLTTVCDRVIL